MSKLMQLTVSALLGLFVLAAAPRLAHAGTGYACNVQLVPTTNSSLGTAGYVFVTFYAAPSCGGGYLTGGYLCSTGATDSSCANYTMTSDQLIATFNSLRSAELSNEKIYYYNNSGAVFTSLQFMAAGF